jgi:tetratricopeptide (TPR) repeat protein
LNKAGSGTKIPAIAEKALANFPENEDLLLFMTETAMNRKQTDRALNYANRLTASINKHGKPEGMPAADWERKRTAALGRGYWVAGVLSAEKGAYLIADKNLRAAVPLLQGNEAMLGPALFYLGMANYQLGKMTLSKAKMLEAVKFSEQSMVINSPYSDQARHNALVMKDEAARMR